MQKLMRLRLRDISKSFGNCLANDRVSLSIAAGEIHAVLGENGAGKSTLMKIIYGVEQADSGSLLWQGEPLHNHHPSRARELGIGMVFQHFTLFETLTVAENIALSLPPGDASDRKLLAQKIRDVSRRYGMALEPDRYVHTLSVGEQQRVEIVRCLLQHVQLLILDEPTSVLTPQEVATLFTALRQLAAEGCSILFISHKLEEVRSLCERATILRNGQVSGECALAEMSTKDIARMMVGEATSLNEHYPSGQAGKEMLRLDAVTTNSRHPFSVNLSSLSFAVDRGQILGIAGVAGNGQSELMRLLNGELVASKGKIWLDDKEITPLSVAARRQQGLAYIPEDRLGRGAVPNMDLFDNAMLTAHHRGLHRRGWIRRATVKQFADAILSRFGVKAAHGGVQAKGLSGGNLQKFVVGREVLQQPKLLLCANPTWGVDIGSAIMIRHALMDLRDQGAALILVSEDVEELFHLCDRIGAIYNGRLSPIVSTRDTSLHTIGEWMTGSFMSEKSAPEGVG